MESIHPIFIHFPIALLCAAFLIEGLALALKRPAWHRISLWNLGLGVLGTGTAVLTGRQAMEIAKHSMEIYRMMELHERLGYAVLAAGLFLAGWRLLTRDRLGPKARIAAWLLLGITCGTMGFSAHLGGRLVYEFGVGGSYGRSGGIEVSDMVR